MQLFMNNFMYIDKYNFILLLYHFVSAAIMTDNIFCMVDIWHMSETTHDKCLPVCFTPRRKFWFLLNYVMELPQDVLSFLIPIVDIQSRNMHRNQKRNYSVSSSFLTFKIYSTWAKLQFLPHILFCVYKSV